MPLENRLISKSPAKFHRKVITAGSENAADFSAVQRLQVKKRFSTKFHDTAQLKQNIGDEFVLLMLT